MKLLPMLLLLVSTSVMAQTPSLTPTPLVAPPAPVVDNRSADEKAISPVDNRTPDQKAWAIRLSTRQAEYKKELEAQKIDVAAQNAEATKQNADAAAQIAEAKRVQALVDTHNAVCHGEVPQAEYNRCIAEFQTVQPEIYAVNEWRGRVNEWKRTIDVWAAKVDAENAKLTEERAAINKEVSEYFVAIKANPVILK